MELFDKLDEAVRVFSIRFKEIHRKIKKTKAENEQLEAKIKELKSK